MKYLTVPSRGQRGEYLSKADLARVDKYEDRVRLNAEQHQAMLYLAVGRYLVEEGAQRLEEYTRKVGAWRRLRAVVPMLHNAVQLCANKMSCSQLLAMADNLEHMTVTLSATPIGAEGGCLNVRYKTIDAICGQALSACFFCDKSREESKRCEVRKAYEAIPVLKLAARQNASGQEACPYQGLEVPEDAEG